MRRFLDTLQGYLLEVQRILIQLNLQVAANFELQVGWLQSCHLCLLLLSFNSRMFVSTSIYLSSHLFWLQDQRCRPHAAL
jgi:hypothetical protein